MGLEDCDGSCS